MSCPGLCGRDRLARIGSGSLRRSCKPSEAAPEVKVSSKRDGLPRVMETTLSSWLCMFYFSPLG